MACGEYSTDHDDWFDPEELSVTLKLPEGTPLAKAKDETRRAARTAFYRSARLYEIVPVYHEGVRLFDDLKLIYTL